MEGNKTTDEYMSHRSSSVKFKENDFDRCDSSKAHPIWRPAYDLDTDAPQYRSIKPILTPTTGRSSAISLGQSPIPPSEFEKPQKFTSANEQLATTTRDFQVLKPTPVSARAANQSKPFTQSHSPQFYMATAGPPHHQKNISAESSSHMEMHESSESSQRIVNVSSMRKVITFDQQHHHSQSTFEKSLEPFPHNVYNVSPTPMCVSRQKMHLPPTPTKFIPGEFRESDYDSEIESLKIRPMWTPNIESESDRIHYRHVSPPTSSRCASVQKHYFERILTPMEFDTTNVEMPTPIKCLSSSSPPYSNQAANFQTQTLDRFRSKKKTSSHFGSSSQDDINIMHSTPKYSRIRSPGQSYHEDTRSNQYREESRASQYGEFILFNVWIFLLKMNHLRWEKLHVFHHIKTFNSNENVILF